MKDSSRSQIWALSPIAIFLVAAYLFPFHLRPLTAFYNEWLAIVGMMIALLIFLKSSSTKLVVPWIVFLPMGLFVLIVAQLAFGMLNDKWDAFIPLCMLLVASLAIILGANASVTFVKADGLCLVLSIAHLGAALISIVIATLQFYSAELPFAPFMMAMAHPPFTAIRPVANIAQPNHLALLFCIAIASVWWLFQSKRLKAGSSVFLAILLLWGLVLTQSRIGWLIVPSFAIVLCCWQVSGKHRTPLQILLVLTGIYVALFMLLPRIAILTGVTAESTLERLSSGGTTRLVLLHQALEMSRGHPFFGVGWFQFGAVQVDIATQFESSILSRHSHNIFFNFAAEIGWPATLLFFGLAMYWFLCVIRRKEAGKETAFAILIFIAVAIHSMVEFPLWYAYILIPTAIFVGMAHQNATNIGSLFIPKLPITLLCITLFVGSVGIAIDFRRVLMGFTQVEYEVLSLKFDRESTKKPSFTVFPYIFDYFHFMDIEVHEGMQPEEIAFMEKLVRRFGGASNLLRMSQVYAMNEREDDAVRMVLTIRSLHPDRYRKAYEDWRNAPVIFKSIFMRLPPPM